MKTIEVPHSHFDDFVSHMGWWASMPDPQVQVGDAIQFLLPGAPVAYMQTLNARVTRCELLTLDTIEELGWRTTVGRSFVGWHIIFYDSGEGWAFVPQLGEEILAETCMYSAEQLRLEQAADTARWGPIKSLSRRK